MFVACSLFQCDQKKNEEAAVDLFAAEIQKCLSNVGSLFWRSKKCAGGTL